jgi:hypothetical protein
LILSRSNFCAASLLTFPQFLQAPDNDQYHSQLPWWSHIQYTWMPPPMYQHTTNLIDPVYLNASPYVSIHDQSNWSSILECLPLCINTRSI